MSFDWANSGSDDEEQDDGNKSGTHIYFYEAGHERLPGEAGDEAHDTIAAAYETAKTRPDGRVRRYANGNFEAGLQQMLAEFVLAMDASIEQEGPLPILELAISEMPAEGQAQVLAQYLDQNDEVRDLVAELFETTEEAPADD